MYMIFEYKGLFFISCAAFFQPFLKNRKISLDWGRGCGIVNDFSG